MNIDTFFVEPIIVDMNNLISEAVASNESNILQLNKTQLQLGEDSEGESLGEYASYSYKNRWKPVDLYLTGAFYRGLSVVVMPSNDSFDIVGYDEKTNDLQKRYGKNILGISPHAIAEVPEIILSDLQGNFRKEVLT